MVKKSMSILITAIVLIYPIGLFGRGAGSNSRLNTPADLGASASEEEPIIMEKINSYFFYEELCGSCHEDIERFTSILQEKIPLVERDQYPNNFIIFNIYESSGNQEYVRLTDEFGIDRSLLTPPLLIIGGRIFQGYDSIGANIREAYLTAAEDLYVNKKPYNPKTRKTGEHLFDDYTVNPDNVTIVYFYRITCPECAQVTPIIDDLPDTVSVNGREKPLEIIKINTRSGNNGDRVIAFFDTWQVTDEDRMVPIIFFSDSYLAGYDAISAGLRQNLTESSIPWKLLASIR